MGERHCAAQKQAQAYGLRLGNILQGLPGPSQKKGNTRTGSRRG